jgi:hypothetical protein
MFYILNCVNEGADRERGLLRYDAVAEHPELSFAAEVEVWAGDVAVW